MTSLHARTAHPTCGLNAPVTASCIGSARISNTANDGDDTTVQHSTVVVVAAREKSARAVVVVLCPRPGLEAVRAANQTGHACPSSDSPNVMPSRGSPRGVCHWGGVRLQVHARRCLRYVHIYARVYSCTRASKATIAANSGTRTRSRTGAVNSGGAPADARCQPSKEDERSVSSTAS